MNNSQLEAIVLGNFGNIHLDIGEYFEVHETKYKKIALLNKVLRFSQSD